MISAAIVNKGKYGFSYNDIMFLPNCVVTVSVETAGKLTKIYNRKEKDIFIVYAVDKQKEKENSQIETEVKKNECVEKVKEIEVEEVEVNENQVLNVIQTQERRGRKKGGKNKRKF